MTRSTRPKQQPRSTILCWFFVDPATIFSSSGSSIRAAHSSNRDILALESDAELFDEVLKPLQTPTTDTSCDGMDFDDDTPIEDAALLNLCE
jgi:hypothetical protein